MSCVFSLLDELSLLTMHLLILLTALFGLLCHAQAREVTVYAWPTSAKSPSPLAKISYSGPARVESYTPPKVASDEVVRVGLYDPSTKHWSGIATSAASFSPSRTPKIILHIDAKKDVYHVGFSATATSSGAKEGESATVEVVEQHNGPLPVLNKPVVLSPDGRAEAKELEKSFLQK